MHFSAYQPRSHTRKQKLELKPGKSLEQKRAAKKAKILNRHFPFIQLRHQRNKKRGSYQHAMSN